MCLHTIYIYRERDYVYPDRSCGTDPDDGCGVNGTLATAAGTRVARQNAVRKLAPKHDTPGKNVKRSLLGPFLRPHGKEL